MKNTDHLTIIDSSFNVDYSNGEIKGKSIINAKKYLKDLPNIFGDGEAFSKMDEDYLFTK